MAERGPVCGMNLELKKEQAFAVGGMKGEMVSSVHTRDLSHER